MYQHDKVLFCWLKCLKFIEHVCRASDSSATPCIFCSLRSNLTYNCFWGLVRCLIHERTCEKKIKFSCYPIRSDFHVSLWLVEVGCLVSASFPVAAGNQRNVFLHPLSSNGDVIADRGGGQADCLPGSASPLCPRRIPACWLRKALWYLDFKWYWLCFVLINKFLLPAVCGYQGVVVSRSSPSYLQRDDGETFYSVFHFAVFPKAQFWSHTSLRILELGFNLDERRRLMQFAYF